RAKREPSMNDDRLTLNPPPGPARHRYKTGQDSCRRPAKLIVANHKGFIAPIAPYLAATLAIHS
ncbi:hypothetical protein, partial [Variovorax rhizosphaerae]